MQQYFCSTWIWFHLTNLQSRWWIKIIHCYSFVSCFLLFFVSDFFPPHLITDENETKPTWKPGKPPRCDFGVTPLACSVWIMWIHALYNVYNKGRSVSARATHERAAAGRRHAVPKEMLYKKSLRERCANGSCPGARRGLWLEGLEAAEGYFRKRYRK